METSAVRICYLQGRRDGREVRVKYANCGTMLYFQWCHSRQEAKYCRDRSNRAYYLGVARGIGRR